MAGRKGAPNIPDVPPLRNVRKMLDELDAADINDSDPSNVRYVGSRVTRHKPIGQGATVYINNEAKVKHGGDDSARWSLHTEKERKEFCEWIGREYIAPVKASSASSKPKVDKVKEAAKVLQIKATDLF